MQAARDGQALHPLGHIQIQEADPSAQLRSLLAELERVQADARLIHDLESVNACATARKTVRRLTANYIAQLTAVHDQMLQVYGDRADQFCEKLQDTISEVMEMSTEEREAISATVIPLTERRPG